MTFSFQSTREKTRMILYLNEGQQEAAHKQNTLSVTYSSAMSAFKWITVGISDHSMSGPDSHHWENLSVWISAVALCYLCFPPDQTKYRENAITSLKMSQHLRNGPGGQAVQGKSVDLQPIFIKAEGSGGTLRFVNHDIKKKLHSTVLWYTLQFTRSFSNQWTCWSTKLTKHQQCL